MDKESDVWERGVKITCSKKESYTDKRHYTITDALGLRDIIKSTITDASQATGTVTARMLELNKSEYSKSLKKPSFAEDEAENGYQNDTQENKVTKAPKTDGARYVLEFEYTLILVTFARYVQKTTSPICLNCETVAMLSKFVRLDSEICFELTLNDEINCLGSCGTRKQVFFQNVSRVIVMRLLFLNSDFGCVTVLRMNILCGIPQDLKVSQDVSQGMWQNQRAHQFIKLYEFDFNVFALAIEVTGKTIVGLEDEIEENKLTTYVRTSSGKTISIKRDKKTKCSVNIG